jgi:hypothetical protein
LSGGYLLLLDFPSGPHPGWLPLLPLPSDGLVIPNALVLNVLRPASFLSTELPAKFLILLTILLAGTGMFRFLARTVGASTPSALAGAMFFAINPYVYDRLLSGQLFLVLAYAFLGWFLASLAALTAGQRGALDRCCGWVVLIALVNVHVGGMAVVLLLAAIAALPIAWRIRARLGALVVALLVAVNAFWLLPALFAGEGTRLGGGDVYAYAPRPRGPAILYHELLLHGFWRNEFASPLKGNPALFLATFLPLMAAAAAGAVLAVSSPRWRRAAALLGVVALVALVLAMGPSFPPTAPVARWIFDNVPGYGIYREPQKWLALVTLAYAVFAAVGLDRLGARLRSLTHRLPVVVYAAAFLPLLATPTMLWGFSGQVKTSRYPTDWYRAAAQVAPAPGGLLFLPWNLYQPLPFAGDRTIANPAPNFFVGSVLVSDDPALGRADATGSLDPRVGYVQQLLNHRKRLVRFGHLVAPLGVRFVALAHVADAREYGFLKTQRDLSLVFAGKELTLYENRAWRGSVYELRTSETHAPPANLLSSARMQSRAGTHLSPSMNGVTPPPPSPALVRQLPLWKTIRAPSNGVAVGTDLSCRDGWVLGDVRPTCHLGALAAFRDPPPRELLWRPLVGWQLIGWLVSLLSVAVIAVILLKRQRRGPARFGSS